MQSKLKKLPTDSIVNLGNYRKKLKTLLVYLQSPTVWILCHLTGDFYQKMPIYFSKSETEELSRRFSANFLYFSCPENSENKIPDTPGGTETMSRNVSTVNISTDAKCLQTNC